MTLAVLVLNRSSFTHSGLPKNSASFANWPRLFDKAGKYRIVAYVQYYNLVPYSDIEIIEKPTAPAASAPTSSRARSCAGRRRRVRRPGARERAGGGGRGEPGGGRVGEVVRMRGGGYMGLLSAGLLPMGVGTAGLVLTPCRAVALRAGVHVPRSTSATSP